MEGAARPRAARGDQGIPEGVSQQKRTGESHCHNHDTHGCGGASGVHTTVNIWTRDQSMPTGKLLHNSSSKLLINAGKRGPRFSLFLLLLLILAGKSRAKSKLATQAKPLHSLRQPSPTAATVESRGGCQVAGRLPIIFCFCETSLGETAKCLALPCAAAFLFTVLASCGDVVVHLVWPWMSSQAGLCGEGNEMGSGMVVAFLTFTFCLSLNYSQTCELSKQGSSFLHKARFTPGLE